MEIDREALMQTFLAESEENFSAMEEALVMLEARPEDEETLFTIFRAAHTVKGNASCLGFENVAAFAHVVEDVLQHLRNRTVAVSPKLITLLLQAVDALRQMGPSSAAGTGEIQPAHKAILGRLTEAMADKPRPTEDGQDLEPHQDLGIQSDLQNWSDHTKTLRIDIDKLDLMLNLTGEMAIAQGRLKQMIEDLGGKEKQDILEAYVEADRLYRELQEQIMKVRMVPVGPTFRQYIRTVRDLATSHGKVARLSIEGGDVEVDTTVIEHLKDPLTHMIRNALDHGIEPVDVRKAKGKDPCGQITLRAYHDAGIIVIQLVDDGAGFNRERILERAKSRGLVAEADKLTNQEVYRLVFEAGFSTAEEVTDLSGRGVGMDVVQRNIDAIRGSVGIESREGEGATITIRLPLTLAIIEGFSVGVSDETYVIPLDAVVECLELPKDEGCRTESSGVINLRGQALPYLRLRDHFDLGNDIQARENIVVVEYEGGRAGIAVDKLYGESQTVIKPLGKLFHGLPGVSGSTILGNGRVALILDVPTILRDVIGHAPAVA